MNINKFINNFLIFVAKRLIEIFGAITSIFGILLLLALISYSPEDPNFIFPENTKIKNLLGFQGSYVSDIFLQSIGLISFLIPFTYIFTGIKIFKSKEIFVFLENTFYIILYLIIGTLFFNSFYYSDIFTVYYLNGNGGFVGNYLSNNFIGDLILTNQKFSYYILIIFILLFFLLSINFNVNTFFLIIKTIFNKILKKENQNYTNKNEIISEYIPQEEIKNLIQEDLPFIKSDAAKESKNIKFQLPKIDLLKKPLKSEKNRSSDNDYKDPKFLEKILLDFGVDGTIKKIYQGPVVTLNEFEPAAGIKVSKIINLSDDIARNTSSESARIAIIPGRNTIGIELPNSTRENVYLSEILNNSEFKKKDIKLPIALGKNIFLLLTLSLTFHPPQQQCTASEVYVLNYNYLYS